MADQAGGAQDGEIAGLNAADLDADQIIALVDPLQGLAQGVDNGDIELVGLKIAIAFDVEAQLDRTIPQRPAERDQRGDNPRIPRGLVAIEVVVIERYDVENVDAPLHHPGGVDGVVECEKLAEVSDRAIAGVADELTQRRHIVDDRVFPKPHPFGEIRDNLRDRGGEFVVEFRQWHRRCGIEASSLQPVGKRGPGGELVGDRHRNRSWPYLISSSLLTPVTRCRTPRRPGCRE